MAWEDQEKERLRKKLDNERRLEHMGDCMRGVAKGGMGKSMAECAEKWKEEKDKDMDCPDCNDAVGVAFIHNVAVEVPELKVKTEELTKKVMDGSMTPDQHFETVRNMLESGGHEEKVEIVDHIKKISKEKVDENG